MNNIQKAAIVGCGFVGSSIAFTLLHAYLANIEGLAPSMLMFFGKEHGGLTYDIEKHNISGKDDLAH